MLCRPFGASLDEFRKRGILTFDGNRAELVAFLTTNVLVADRLRIAQKSPADCSCGNIAATFHYSPFIFHFSPFTFHSIAFHFPLVRRLVVGSRRTQRRQTADKPIGRRRSDGRQTAD